MLNTGDMQLDEIQSKIANSLNGNAEFERWDSLTATDPDYMLHSPMPVGYYTTSEQHYMFQNLLVGFNPSLSILDIGCGRADLCNFIQNFFGETALYTGIDHNPLMADIAKQKYGYDIITGAFETSKLNKHDWVVACGLFTQRRCNTEDEDLRKLFNDIDIMYNAASSAVAFNLLSPINNKLHEGFFYTHPGLIMDMLIEKYRHIAIRHNYSNDVYTVTIYKINS
jgi:SAM-dependent methyltransferase